MKKPIRVNQAETKATPAQVWETLTARQQKTVMQTVVRICRAMMAKWSQEKSHEPASNS